ncbi:hypothetical protein [Mesobacillus zeae]|uniref:DUF3967 domain-containing protein n=1 Tax=Mesobacillus zeae TaxID=1917180 RepID=A0A398B0E7_9BACI|nr:hypothetical protein [Mesobacillus zeae]RID81460.1 hypothetical protein D1970_21805 [Mesobacillus zeae]
MDDETKDTGEQIPVNLEKQNEAVKKLATDLFAKESSLDFAALMRMATNLISNEDMINTVKEIGSLKVQDPVNSTSKKSVVPKTDRMTEHFDELKKEIAFLKQEMVTIQAQNEYLRETLLHMMETSKRKKWWIF